MISRRQFFYQASGGFLGSALGGLWAQDRQAMFPRGVYQTVPKVRSVIYLFMCGGVSHIDTFDPKGNKHAGKMIEADRCHWLWRQSGSHAATGHSLLP